MTWAEANGAASAPVAEGLERNGRRMDCTVFEWETRAPVAAVSPADRSFDSRALLRRHLRLAYAAPHDNPFADVLRALDAPNENR